MTTQLHKVKFDLIRYANCWEDADILLKGLAPQNDQKIISIGSAGDNSFSLLTTNPEIVVAVDINPVQLFVIELKKLAIQHMDYDDFLGFLGFREMNGEQRIQLYKSLHLLLPFEARSYWNGHENLIKSGFIREGKFEKYFHLFRTKVLPWIHSSQTIKQLFEEKSAQAQKEFYDKNWNTWRWRALFSIFFSKPVMGRLGRDPEFLKQVNLDVADFIFSRAERQLSSPFAQTNYFLRHILAGDFSKSLPHFAREEHFEHIKSNIGALHIVKGLAEQVFETYGMFQYANLSNIFEYMDANTFETVGTQLAKGISAGGRLAYWNLMVPRRLSHTFPQHFSWQKQISQDFTAMDKGFFYQSFIIDQKL